jgi:monovalent cation:H+ antiporter-2, CPA2 family
LPRSASSRSCWRALDKLPLRQWGVAPSIADGPDLAGLEDHVIICGYGRVARELAGELALRGEPYVVIEYNPAVVAEARAQGVPVSFGDAGNPVVLERSNVAEARLLAVLVPDSHAAELATRYARQANPGLDIIARAMRGADVAHLLRAGATEVVQPEFEAGVEVLRHTLRLYGDDADSIEERLTARRDGFYRSGLV